MSLRSIRDRRARTLVGALTGVLLFASCGGYRRNCPVLPSLPSPSLTAGAPAGDAIEIRFLGVAGFLIRRTTSGANGLRTDAVLTAPLYTNPTALELATSELSSDQRLIDALLPPVDDVQVLLVGHSHYDHLMDVPYIALHRARSAIVYGSDTMRDLLAPLSRRPDFGPDRIVSLEPWANSPAAWFSDNAERWRPYHVPKTRLRIWTVLSEHAPQFRLPRLVRGIAPKPLHLWRGRPLEPPDALPASASQWTEGTTLAYVIDFLDVDATAASDDWVDEHVVFRIYFQDAAARAPFGVPPIAAASSSGRAGAASPNATMDVGAPIVDLALLCAAGSDQIPDHPGEIARALRPRFAIAHHWEDFLNPRMLPLPQAPGAAPPCETIHGVPTWKADRFTEALRRALPASNEFCVPCPDAVTRFVRRGGAWEIDATTATWRHGSRAAKP